MSSVDSRAKGSHETGLALTELLVTLLLSLMLIAGVVSVFTGGLRSADSVLVSERLVLGGNAAIARLQADLRQAGFSGCNSSLSGASSPWWNIVAEASDQVWLRTVTEPIWGKRGPSIDLRSPVDEAMLGTNLDPRSDLLVVGFASGPGQRISAHIGVGASDAAELVTAAASNLAEGSIVLASRCDSAAIFKVDQISTATNRSLRILRGIGNRHSDLGTDFTGAELYPWQQHIWYVLNESGVGILYRNQERIAEGVVQFLTEFGVDNSGDRQVDNYVSAAEVRDWSHVLSVRAHLLMAAETEETGEEPPQALDFAGQRYVANDSRHYQSFTTTVGLRNRLP